MVEIALGQYSSGLVSEWSPPDGFDADEVSARMPDSLEVWSDGCMVLDSFTGVSAAGAGMFAHQSEFCWGGRRWGHVDRVQSVGVAHSCRAFVSVPGTVQRAELWEVILALQSADAVHVGFDNLGVVWHFGRLLDHADEALVRAGTVRGLDKLGNDGADEAGDFGRGRVPWWVIDAMRHFSGVCSRWRLVVLVLHRFFIAISRDVVNHDGGVGISIDLLVWSAGSAPKRRRVAVRNRAFLLGPLGLWVGSWIAVAVTPISCRDIEVWLYSVGMLVKWVAFLHSLHWLADGCSLGVGGVLCGLAHFV